ncbi:hypothetical protein ONZ45_g13921 [Pleurotus djamor]|nr:hypothetical protein ONZ45_g13921 [Pleurotus djamor]
MSATTAVTTEASSSSLTLHVDAGVDTAEERKTMRRVDFRLIPILSLLFSVTTLDRANIGLAFVSGMGSDLKLTVGNRYSLVTSLHSFSYPIGEILGLLFIPLLGPRLLLTLCMVFWGSIQLSMGFITDWRYLALCRALLGFAEGPVIPSMIFLISAWHTKYEIQRRVAVVSVVGHTSTAFGPILAFSLVHLDGARGLRGWSWIFIFEGALTVSCGVLALILVPGFPHKNTFLTTSQTQLVRKRVEADSVPDKVTPETIVRSLKDWVLWAHGFMLFCALIPSIAMIFFMPIILAGMGWSGTRLLLMSAPPYLFASLSTLLIGWWSDKQQMRAPFIAGQGIMSLVGLLMTAFAQAISVRYLGVFLLVAGSTGSLPSIATYSVNNSCSYSKRATSLVLTIALGSIGGIATVNLFREKDAPHYIPGLCFAIGCQGLLLILLLLTTIHYRRMNNSVRSGKVDNIEGQPGFLYTI